MGVQVGEGDPDGARGCLQVVLVLVVVVASERYSLMDLDALDTTLSLVGALLFPLLWVLSSDCLGGC